MPELAAPLDRNALSRAWLASLEWQHQQIQLMQAEFRLSLNGWVREGFDFGDRDYAHDEFALAFAESVGTAKRTIEVAQRFADYPTVVARVGLPPSEGGWSIRHADAALDAICSTDATREQQEQILDLVAAHPDARTPYQIRKAIQAALIVLDPEAAAKRFEKAKTDRHVGSYAHDDGAAASFWATGTAAQIAQVMASIDALAGPKQPGDDRNLAQRRFDAFMDLICGRVQPGQWQAVIVMTLATMDGGDEPAEIPGYGLVSAEQARELIPHAELRRAVVDEHGALVSLDTRTHTPDQVPERIVDPARQISHDVEPEPLDRTPEHQPSADDLRWLDQQLDQREATEPDTADTADEADAADEIAEVADDRSLEDLVRHLTSDLETALRVLLDEHALISVGSGLVVETDGIVHRRDTGGSDDGSGGSGGGGSRPPSDGDGHPPVPPVTPVTPDATVPEPSMPEPATTERGGDPGSDLGGEPGGDPPDEPPPSVADELWNDSTLDREAQDSFQPAPVYQREPDPPYGQRPKPIRWTSSWSLTALRRARDKIRTAPLEPIPADSKAYALPPRLARFVKTRDITCVFPVCTRLSRQCENDHLIPWPQGPTAERNINSGCKHHHLAKHHYFTVERLPNGGIRWHTPLGRSYDRNPRPLLRGW